MTWNLATGGLRGEVLARVTAASDRILIASPFVSRRVGEELANAIAERPDRDVRMLTALVPGSVAGGVLSVPALRRLIQSGASLASIRNLHAKLVVADNWVLVGSGNLTDAGLNLGNVELGLVGATEEAEQVAARFEGWWKWAGENDGADESAIWAWLRGQADVGPTDWQANLDEFLDGALGKALVEPPSTLTGVPGETADEADQSPPLIAVAPSKFERADLYDLCVQTVQKREKTLEAARQGTARQLVETRSWREASSWLDAARSQGKRLAVLFAASDAPIGANPVTHWAVVDAIDIDDGGISRVAYSATRTLDPPRRLSELTGANTRRPLSDTDIYPRRYCVTPDFL